MFSSILIANRGEIACRVMRTARRMGIRTVAVYSDADAGAMHVAAADIAYPIGPAPARDSYLNIARILDAARHSGAEAIHPGYGFLSENAEFAEACAAAGVVFIGPPPAAIRAMGSKSAAKSLMEQAGVPLVPGYHGANQDPAQLATEAARIGYPVLIKASAGGGGKGMRVVERAGDFMESLAGAKGEAASSFGDDHVLIERYLTRPRHIEIQVFADTHGHTISLFERDCSIQRRHQKVVEEAPAPGMDPARRAQMGEAACAAARAIGYTGAGTVEFIAENDDFFFMEMNTRLQVEHPVTEMVTGLDLVEWQLRVAAGQPMPAAPAAPRGHAIEVRIYAEDPDRDFMPAVGRIDHLRQPDETANVRIDTGVRAGDTISVHYDPMIAKLIVWDQDRDGAVRRLRHALAGYELVGPRTNLDLLRRIAGHPAFAAAALDTGFIARHAAELTPAPSPSPREVLAAVAAFVVGARSPVPSAADPWSPWDAAGSWRMNGSAAQEVVLHDHAGTHTVRIHSDWTMDLPDGTVQSGPAGGLNGVRTAITIHAGADQVVAIWAGVNWPFRVLDPLAPPLAEHSGAGQVTAPMPGRVIELCTQPGATVSRGDILLIIEAMKVQMRLTAPRDGVIGSVRVTVGDLVDDGAELVTYA